MKPYAQAKLEFREAYFRQLLEQADGKVVRAAKISHINRTALYRHLKQLGIARQPVNRGNAVWRYLGECARV